MDISQVLYKIDNEDIEIIQEEIFVQFDNKQQCPLGFSWGKKHFEVLDLYRVIIDEGGNSDFLVMTNGGIYNLVLVRESKEKVFSRSRWVLNCRVKEDDQPGLVEHGPVLLKGGSLMLFKISKYSSVRPLPFLKKAITSVGEDVHDAHECVPVLYPVHGHVRGRGYKQDEHAHGRAYPHYAYGGVYDGLLDECAHAGVKSFP